MRGGSGAATRCFPLTLPCAVRSDLVLKHLLAFRWSNPNALTYLHEHRTTTGESAYVTYELCAYAGTACSISAAPHPFLHTLALAQGTAARGSSASSPA